jgi:hypothetical protein
MSGVAARLGPGQKAGIAALAAAKTPAAQQRAGRRLERSCRDALRRLRRVAAPAFVRPQHVEIVRSLQGLCGAYGDLAAAAGPSGSAVRYDKARKAVTAADARFRAAGTELQSFGYGFS